jgi:two-component system, response regulator YesN
MILNRYSRVLESNANLQSMIDTETLLRRNRFIENLLHGHLIDLEVITAHMQEYRIRLDGVCWVCSVYLENQRESISDDWNVWQETKSALFGTAERIISTSRNLQGLSCELPNEEIVLIIAAGDAVGNQPVPDFIERYLASLDSTLREKVQIGVSKPIFELTGFEQGYAQSRQALRIGLLREHPRVHYFENVAPRNTSVIDYERIVSRFADLAGEGTALGIEGFVDEIILQAQSCFSTYENGLDYYLKIILHSSEYLERNYGVVQTERLETNPILLAVECTTIGEMRQFLTGFFHTALLSIREHLHAISSTTVKVHSTMKYIEDNFTDKSLNLAKAADSIGSNPSYLSRIFSRETGVSFQEYLTRLRIKASKELIGASAMPLYRIAEQTGFGSVLSFNRAFRKHEGCSPGEYRNRHHLVSAQASTDGSMDESEEER